VGTLASPDAKKGRGPRPLTLRALSGAKAPSASDPDSWDPRFEQPSEASAPSEIEDDDIEAWIVD